MWRGLWLVQLEAAAQVRPITAVSMLSGMVLAVKEKGLCGAKLLERPIAGLGPQVFLIYDLVCCVTVGVC